jgi:hypothetical protein
MQETMANDIPNGISTVLGVGNLSGEQQTGGESVFLI